MPYVFAHEDVFMIGAVVLIVALLIARVIVARRRRLISSIHSQPKSTE